MVISKKIDRSSGVTIVELLVTLTITIILLSLVYYVIAAQSRSYGIQDQISILQQNMRFAIEVLSKHLKLAGYGTRGYTSGAGEDYIYAISSGDNYFGDNSDYIQIVYMDPATMAMLDPDIIHPCSTTNLYFEEMGYATYFSEGDYIICFDFSSPVAITSLLFLASGDGDGSTGRVPVYQNTDTEYLNQCPSTDNIPPDAYCGIANIYTFYIDKSQDSLNPGSESNPVLMRKDGPGYPNQSFNEDDVPLVEDIEDLQFAYCLQGSDCTDSTQWVDSIPSGSETLVRQVRVSVIARSDREDPSGRLFSHKPAVENGSEGPIDSYSRRIARSVISVRNLRYMDFY